MIGRLAPLTLLAVSTLLGGCIAEERVVYVPETPEQDAAEIVEVSPGPGSVYVSGHWEWNGARYAWVRAHYLRKPHGNLAWVEGHWQDTPKGWYWQEGHWAEPHAPRLPKAYRPHPHAAPQQAPQAPPESTETPEGGEMQTDPNVPPAPTYAPPAPPANIPPPPGGGVVVPQHYLQQQPGVGY